MFLPGIGPSLAQEVHGRVEIQDVYASETPRSLSAVLDESSRRDFLGDFRVTWEPKWHDWSFAAAYEVNGDSGDTPALTAYRAALGVFSVSLLETVRNLSETFADDRTLTAIQRLDRLWLGYSDGHVLSSADHDMLATYSAALGLFPVPPPATWWNLSNTFIDDLHMTATQRLDRLWIGYSSNHLVLRIGRQALTWGSGLVFRPMDLFDPFAPNATDTEYKPGMDMVYGQWLFDDGSDLQFIAVPRPARVGGGLTSNASSLALHFNTTIGGMQTTWIVARDRRDWVAGVGINGELGQATWNAEIVPTFVHGGQILTSGIVNISDATTIFGRDVTLFAEYYRNGFGLAARRYALIDLPAPLRDRLVRGQVFDTGRDYLAAGAQLQWSPLFQVNPTLIANLDDRGFYGVVQGIYSLRENLNFIVGSQIPIAPSGTEFGGLPLIQCFPIFVEQPKLVYVQLRQYF
jgi:hypothetical protein